MENGPARDVDGDGMGMLRVVGEGCSETQGCAKGSRGNSLVGRAGTGLGSFRGKKKKKRFLPAFERAKKGLWEWIQRAQIGKIKGNV